MHLCPANGYSTRLFWTMCLFKGNSQVVLGDGCELRSEFACSPAGSINCCRVHIINDLPGRQILSRNQRKMLCEGRRDGEVACRNDSELAGLCSLFNVCVIARRQPGRSHDHTDAFVQCCENVAFHYIRPSVVDEDIG